MARKTIGVTLILSLAALAFFAVAGQSAGGKSSRVDVVLKEMTVNSSQKQVKAGKVTIAVRNAGATDHELVVLRWSSKDGALPVKGYKVVEGDRNMGETEIPAGKSATLKLNLPAGEYVLICNFHGHYQLGMHATLKAS
jgi:uncharacterized cupredoxin-like copper-binding protein